MSKLPELAYIDDVKRKEKILGGTEAAVIDLDAAKARRFLGELRNNPFMAVVLHNDDEVCIFSKDIGPGEVARIREAIEESLSERSEVGSQEEEE